MDGSLIKRHNKIILLGWHGITKRPEKGGKGKALEVNKVYEKGNPILRIGSKCELVNEIIYEISKGRILGKNIQNHVKVNSKDNTDTTSKNDFKSKLVLPTGERGRESAIGLWG